MASAETKAFNLWREMSYLLGAYKQMEKINNSEPLFDNPIVKKAEAALFENRPLADWEQEDRDMRADHADLVKP